MNKRSFLKSVLGTLVSPFLPSVKPVAAASILELEIVSIPVQAFPRRLKCIGWSAEAERQLREVNALFNDGPLDRPEDPSDPMIINQTV